MERSGPKKWRILHKHLAHIRFRWLKPLYHSKRRTISHRKKSIGHQYNMIWFRMINSFEDMWKSINCWTEEWNYLYHYWDRDSFMSKCHLLSWIPLRYLNSVPVPEYLTFFHLWIIKCSQKVSIFIIYFHSKCLYFDSCREPSLLFIFGMKKDQRCARMSTIMGWIF